MNVEVQGTEERDSGNLKPSDADSAVQSFWAPSMTVFNYDFLTVYTVFHGRVNFREPEEKSSVCHTLAQEVLITTGVRYTRITHNRHSSCL